jgi:membrane associated rhomboid family serine protease
MEPTKQDAEAMLTGAGGIESAVRARAPQEHPLYFAMGLTFMLTGLIFDLTRAGDGGDYGATATVAVLVVAVVVVAVMVATHLPYWRRYRQVRKRSTPKWLEWALGAWFAASLFGLGILLNGSIGFSYTLGGIVAAVPCLLWAERLRRTA